MAPRAEGKAETGLAVSWLYVLSCSMLLGYSKKADLCCSELLWAVLNALALACASFGSSRNYPGALLEPSWASLGPVLDHLGSILGYFGPVFGHLGSILGDLSLVLDLSWAILGLSWTILGMT